MYKPKRSTLPEWQKKKLNIPNHGPKLTNGNAHIEPKLINGSGKEARVAFFVKRLLEAVQQLHSRDVAHLDLKPENIMVSESVEDQIRLVDFGSSKQLIEGLDVTAEVNDPEFTAPEIMLQQTVTLAADMWALGVLTYILLSGISPFHGDSDQETKENVIKCRWQFDPLHFKVISKSAQDFVSGLLVLKPNERPTVSQCLDHPWLKLGSTLSKGIILNTAFLKEFKYRHNWVDRRVFVKSSPDEEETEDLSPPPSIDLYFKPTVSVEPERDHSFVTQTLPLLKHQRMADEDTNGFAPGENGENVNGDHLSTPENGDINNSNKSENTENKINGLDNKDSKSADNSLNEKPEPKPEPKNVEQNRETSPKPAVSEEKLRMKERSGNGNPQLETNGGESDAIPEDAIKIQVKPNTPVKLDVGGPPKFPTIPEADETTVDDGGKGKMMEEPSTVTQTETSRSTTAVENGIIEETTTITTTKTTTVEGETSEDFDKLMNDVDEAKEKFHNRMTELRNLNRRLEQAAEEAEGDTGVPDLTSSIYKSNRQSRIEQLKQRAAGGSAGDYELPKRKIVPLEELDWETEYQTGPETYLLQLRDADFAGRIRDYRRQMFGDENRLNYREKHAFNVLNGCISVKERRRYVDVIREDGDIRANMEQMETSEKMQKFPRINRFRRVNLIPTVVFSDKGHAPIFQSRLPTISLFTPDISFTLTCVVTSYPRPDIQWFRNDELIECGERFSSSFEPTTGEIKLKIDPIYPTDAGVYKCLAMNNYGNALCASQLTEADLPERPSRPDVELASDTEVLLTWSPPATGGCTEEIAAYKVDYRKAGEEQWSSPWVIISSNVQEEACVVRHLECQGIYQFRITAKNGFGWGAPSLASRIIQTHPKGAHKLSVEVLKQEYNFGVINVPQSSSAVSNSGLGEIMEECEESGVSDTEGSGSLPNGNMKDYTSKQPDLNLNTSQSPEDRYQLDAELFRGSFSVVREAIDNKSENASHCVGKIIYAAGDCKQAVTNEYETLRELQHNRVVTLQAAYLKNDYGFLFLEKLHETVLDRLVIHDYYTEENVSQVVSQLFCALQWIHFKGFIHLNIQADNIMLTGKRGWNIKLIDTGYTTKISTEGDTKPPEWAKIAPEFSSPELLQHGIVTPASDVWNVGVLMFTLLSGFHPFNSYDDDTEEEVIHNITQTRTDLNYIHNNASDDAQRFLTWCLKKHPSNRMTTEEGLQHPWTSLFNPSLRRRENIRFSANRLRHYAAIYSSKRLHVVKSLADSGDEKHLKLVSAYGVAKPPTPERDA